MAEEYIVGKNNTKMVSIAYESLLENPNFPKSRWQLFKSLIKNGWCNFKKTFPKSFVFSLVFALLLSLFFVFYLAVIVDTFSLSK